MKYTIEQLVEQVNSQLVSGDVSDGRVSSNLSVRRVRDYQSKGLLREPSKNGRNTYYDDEHVEQLVALRSLQSSGLTDSFMQKLSTTSPLYYQSAEVQEQISANVGISSSYISANSLAESSMKEKALAALSKCAVNSQDSNLEQKAISTNLAYRSISAVGANPLGQIIAKSAFPQASVESNNLKEKIAAMNHLEAGAKKKEEEDFWSLPIDFQVSPEKEKEHAKRREDSLRKPRYNQVYDVHERVTLEIKAPYEITDEDKLKIIERLKDIINSL